VSKIGLNISTEVIPAYRKMRGIFNNSVLDRDGVVEVPFTVGPKF
jgi:hypothetical protein